MLLDYMIAKYDSWFAYEKKEMLSNAPLSPTVLGELILNKLISIDQIAGFARKIGKPPSDAALDLILGGTLVPKRKSNWTPSQIRQRLHLDTASQEQLLGKIPRKSLQGGN